MLLGHVQDMVQRLAANRRERQPRSKKEKMLDLLGPVIRRVGKNSRPKRSNASKPRSGKRPAGNGAENGSSDGSW